MRVEGEARHAQVAQRGGRIDEVVGALGQLGARNLGVKGISLDKIVGSVDKVISAARLRPEIIDAIEARLG